MSSKPARGGKGVSAGRGVSGRGRAAKPKPAGRGAGRGAARGAERSSRGVKAGRGVGRAVAKGVKGKSKGKGKGAAKPKVDPEAKKRNAAAVVCQRAIREYLAKLKAIADKAKQEAYEKEMDLLQHDAWIVMVKREQEEERARYAKMADEKRAAREKAKKERELRDAAFDGEMDDVKEIVDGEVDINCKDANDETPLLEASGGGHRAICEFLIASQADVNARGRYQRTALFRAAFAGHTDTVTGLLLAGCDPRLFDSEGSIPIDVAAAGACKDALANWDIANTDKLLAVIAERQEKIQAAKVAEQTALGNSLEDELAMARKDFGARQSELKKAYIELEKRMVEYDMVTVGPERKAQSICDTVMQTIKQSERELAKRREAADVASKRLQAAKKEIRKHEHAVRQEDSDDSAAFEKCNFREFDDLVMKDLGGRFQEDGRWPLVIDHSKQIATFMRYRDTNYLNACSPKDMEKETLRRALLGALRYGKPMVIDMMEVDLFAHVKGQIDTIEDGLMDALLSKELLKPKWYEKLIRKKDGEDYDVRFFTEDRLATFNFLLITLQDFPEEELCEACFPIDVIPSPPVGN